MSLQQIEVKCGCKQIIRVMGQEIPRVSLKASTTSYYCDNFSERDLYAGEAFLTAKITSKAHIFSKRFKSLYMYLIFRFPPAK